MYHVQLQITQIHKILTDVSWISCTLYSPKETSIFFNDKFSHLGICFKMRNWDSFENTKIYKEILILWCRCPQTHVRGMDFNLERTHKYFPVYFAGFPLYSPCTALVFNLGRTPRYFPVYFAGSPCTVQVVQPLAAFERAGWTIIGKIGRELPVTHSCSAATILLSWKNTLSLLE